MVVLCDLFGAYSLEEGQNHRDTHGKYQCGQPKNLGGVGVVLFIGNSARLVLIAGGCCKEYPDRCSDDNQGGEEGKVPQSQLNKKQNKEREAGAHPGEGGALGL